MNRWRSASRAAREAADLAAGLVRRDRLERAADQPRVYELHGHHGIDGRIHSSGGLRSAERAGAASRARRRARPRSRHQVVDVAASRKTRAVALARRVAEASRVARAGREPSGTWRGTMLVRRRPGPASRWSRRVPSEPVRPARRRGRERSDARLRHQLGRGVSRHGRARARVAPEAGTRATPARVLLPAARMTRSTRVQSLHGGSKAAGRLTRAVREAFRPAKSRGHEDAGCRGRSLGHLPAPLLGGHVRWRADPCAGPGSSRGGGRRPPAGGRCCSPVAAAIASACRRLRPRPQPDVRAVAVGDDDLSGPHEGQTRSGSRQRTGAGRTSARASDGAQRRPPVAAAARDRWDCTRASISRTADFKNKVASFRGATLCSSWAWGSPTSRGCQERREGRPVAAQSRDVLLDDPGVSHAGGTPVTDSAPDAGGARAWQGLPGATPEGRPVPSVP